MPSKRRTIQPQQIVSTSSTNLPNSNSSSHLSTFCKPLKNNDQQKQTSTIDQKPLDNDDPNEKSTNTNNTQILIEKNQNIITTTISPSEYNSIKINNEVENVQIVDEMQQIVEYMKKFEKENNPNKNNNNDENDSSRRSPIVIENNEDNDDVRPKQLRLSSSSLSSSVHSLSNDKKVEEVEEVLYEEILESNLNKNALNDEEVTLESKVSIDRRNTYVINKIYDNLNDQDYFNDDMNQYEKVILQNSSAAKASSENLDIEPEEVVEIKAETLKNEEDDYYENVKNTAKSDKPSAEPPSEHIYVNVSGTAQVDEKEAPENETEKIKDQLDDMSIRESTGFEIADLINAKETVIESTNFQIVDDFDSELKELNNQIKDLLNQCEASVSQNQKPELMVKRRTLPPQNINNNTTSSENGTSNSIPKSVSNDEILEPNKVQPLLSSSFRNKKRKSNENSQQILISLDAIETGQHSTTPHTKPQVMPKTRQSLSAKQSNLMNNCSSKIINENGDSNLKTQRNISKSLQDNSKFVLKPFNESNNITLVGPQTEEEKKFIEDLESASVKSKIKLMESIVQSTTISSSNSRKSCHSKSLNNSNGSGATNERSSSTSSSKSTSSTNSSSSSGSSSRRCSPHQIILPPGQQLDQKEEINVVVSCGGSVVTQLDTNEDLASENLKRKTVKELLSQFEAK